MSSEKRSELGPAQQQGRLISVPPPAPVLSNPTAAQLEGARSAYQSGDYATVLRLWQPLASAGNNIDQFGLALLYDQGRGVPQDYAEAAKWLRKAADQGLASPQFLLGNIYAEGKGVQQDYVEAHKWYNLAASSFAASQDTAMRDGAILARDKLVAPKMTIEQLLEAQRLAREWKPATLSIAAPAIVGTWNCFSQTTGRRLRKIYYPDGAMCMSAVDTGPVYSVSEHPISWHTEGANWLVESYPDGQRFTKTRVTTLTGTLLVTVATNVVQVECSRV